MKIPKILIIPKNRKYQKYLYTKNTENTQDTENTTNIENTNKLRFELGSTQAEAVRLKFY